MTNLRNNYTKDHHYLPKCFLKAWTYDQNQTLLWVYRKEGNRVFGPSSKSTTSVCYKKHLYTRSECVEEKDKYKMETESFQNIDNEASNYLEYLTKQRGPINLSPKEKEPFSVFLNSLKARTPEIIERHKLQAVPILQDNLKELLPYFKEKNPERYENFGLDTIVKFIRDKELINLISAMHWAIISIEDDYQNLLTSDRPLIRDGDIKQPMFGLVLAISPHKIFVANNIMERVQQFINYNPTELTKILNIKVLQQAEARGFSSNTNYPKIFFEENLKILYQTYTKLVL